MYLERRPLPPCGVSQYTCFSRAVRDEDVLNSRSEEEFRRFSTSRVMAPAVYCSLRYLGLLKKILRVSYVIQHGVDYEGFQLHNFML